MAGVCKSEMRQDQLAESEQRLSRRICSSESKLSETRTPVSKEAIVNQFELKPVQMFATDGIVAHEIHNQVRKGSAKVSQRYRI